jgi:hypothetical protein
MNTNLWPPKEREETRRRSRMMTQKKLGLLLFMFTLLQSGDSWCLSTMGPAVKLGVAGPERSWLSLSQSCPKRFIGHITKVTQPTEPLHSLSKNSYSIQVLDVKAGEVSQVEDVSIIRNSPIKLLKGKNYLIEMRGRFLCSAKGV